MPEDVFDVPVPATVGDFVKILQQYPEDLPLRIYCRDDKSLKFMDIVLNTPSLAEGGSLQVMFWAG